MNKHGQTLILFIILIPVVLALAALVVDVGLIINEKVHLQEVSRSIIKTSSSEEEIKYLLKENDIPVDNLVINIEDNQIELQNEYTIASIFGKIVGIMNYTIKIDITSEISE